MGVIPIDYQVLTLVAIFLFAAVGFVRGVMREGITTVLLAGLVAVLYKPEIIAPIAAWLNKLIKLIKIVWMDAGKFDMKAMAKSAETAPDIFTKDNPYNLLLYLLLILIAFSFIGSQITIGDKKLSVGSRLLGGILGAINGFIAVSLFKEYLLRYLMNLTAAQAGGAAAAAVVQAVPKGGVSVTVQNLPQESAIGGVATPLIIGLGIALLFLIVNNALQGHYKPPDKKK